MGNIHSIIKALALYSNNIVFSSDPEIISNADALVLPGDGAFGAAMNGLYPPLKDALLTSVKNGVPLLGICIGFQIMFQDSNENGLHKGLGLLNGKIRKFNFTDPSVRIPHMGWNQLNFRQDSIFKSDQKSPYVYFIHSYRAQDVPEDQILATCDYNTDTFAAIVKKNNITAMQFHPEKSDTVGLSMLKNWVMAL